MKLYEEKEMGDKKKRAVSEKCGIPDYSVFFSSFFL